MTALGARISAAVLVLSLVGGCQSTPVDYKPDPKLKTASLSALKSRIVAACVVTQRAKASLSTPQLQKSCGCYADRTFKDLSKDEVTFYRENGYFNESGRVKGQAALTACNLTV